MKNRIPNGARITDFVHSHLVDRVEANSAGKYSIGESSVGASNGLSSGDFGVYATSKIIGGIPITAVEDNGKSNVIINGGRDKWYDEASGKLE